MCHTVFEVNEKTYQSIVFDVIDIKHGFEVSQLHAHINMKHENDFSFTLFLTID